MPETSGKFAFKGAEAPAAGSAATPKAQAALLAGAGSLNIFTKPKQAMAAAIAKPNMALAAGIILVSWLVDVIAPVVTGVVGAMELISAATLLVAVLVMWIGYTIALYIVSYVIKGPSIKGKFKGLLAGMAWTTVPAIIASIVGYMAVAPIAGSVAAAQAGALTAAGLDAAIESLMPLFGAVVFIFLVLLAWWAYLTYVLVKESAEAKTGTNIAVTAIIVAIILAVSFFAGPAPAV